MIFIDGNNKRKKVHSNYWLKGWDNDSSLTSYMSDKEKSSFDIYKLAAAKRAISNFVNIVTNQTIPVTFNERGDSYTDGVSVVIGAEVVNPSDFDVAVGLALHEGSHIKLSDFSLLRNLSSLIPVVDDENGVAVGIYNVKSLVKDLWNYVEDRRIDFYIYSSSPGYREYYRAMYDKYFNSPLIDKALQSNEKRTETLDSYLFRIINMHNSNTDLSALKGMYEIYNVIGLSTISRLKNSNDALNVALEVYRIIVKYLDVAQQEAESNEKSQGDGSNESGDSNESDEPITLTDEQFQDMLDNTDFGDESTDSNGGAPSKYNSDSGEPDESTDSNGGSTSNAGGDAGDMVDGNATTPTKVNEIILTANQKALLEKKIKDQKKFLDGDVKKKTVSKKTNKELQAVEDSGSELQEVGTSVESRSGRPSSVQCIVVKKLTKSLLESSAFPMSHVSYGGTTAERYMESEVADGIRIGTSLGKKLQVRSEDRTTIYNRQKIGKIDKRMVSSLGYGNENVFQFNDVDSYNNANLHISIDASGSMSGTKWSNTITNVVAMCKAVDMISGLEIQVSFRTSADSKPYIVLAYDSRVDKFSKVRQMFPCLRVNGTTPEGLCFEAIMKHFLASTTNLDSYFINISDGEPYFSGDGFYYSGDPAAQHTKKMVKKIEGMGIKTLSYFVSSGTYDSLSPLFKTMYGSGAHHVDITNISQITKTVNKLFMTK